MSCNFYKKKLNVLLQNVMRTERFEICIIKLIEKLISRELKDHLNSNCALSLFYGVEYTVEKSLNCNS